MSYLSVLPVDLVKHLTKYLVLNSKTEETDEGSFLTLRSSEVEVRFVYNYRAHLSIPSLDYEFEVTKKINETIFNLEWLTFLTTFAEKNLIQRQRLYAQYIIKYASFFPAIKSIPLGFIGNPRISCNKGGSEEIWLIFEPLNERIYQTYLFPEGSLEWTPQQSYGSSYYYPVLKWLAEISKKLLTILEEKKFAHLERKKALRE